MKWLFLLLLIINIGVFAWGYQQEQIEKQPTIEAGADIGNMRLISELTDEEKQEIVEATVEPVSQVATAETEEPDQEHPVDSVEKDDQTSTAETETRQKSPVTETVAKAETVSKPVVETKEEVASQPEVETKEEMASKPEVEAKEEAALKPEIEAKEETASKPKVEAKTDPAKETLTEQQVASFTKKSIEQKLEKPAEDEKVAETKPEIISRCGIVGPLKDRQVAKGVMEDLKKSKFQAKLERSIEKQQIGYWVVIPPLADGSQAQAKIEELAKVGLKDIWHFRGGGLKNAISLGMFSKKENADNFSKEVLKKGFKTKMQPRYLNKTNYLVKFTIAKPKTVAGHMWRMVERKYSKMPFKEQACESIATR